MFLVFNIISSFICRLHYFILLLFNDSGLWFHLIYLIFVKFCVHLGQTAKHICTYCRLLFLLIHIVILLTLVSNTLNFLNYLMLFSCWLWFDNRWRLSVRLVILLHYFHGSIIIYIPLHTVKRCKVLSQLDVLLKVLACILRLCRLLSPHLLLPLRN